MIWSLKTIWNHISNNISNDSNHRHLSDDFEGCKLRGFNHYFQSCRSIKIQAVSSVSDVRRSADTNTSLFQVGNLYHISNDTMLCNCCKIFLFLSLNVVWCVTQMISLSLQQKINHNPCKKKTQKTPDSAAGNIKLITVCMDCSYTEAPVTVNLYHVSPRQRNNNWIKLRSHDVSMFRSDWASSSHVICLFVGSGGSADQDVLLSLKFVFRLQNFATSAKLNVTVLQLMFNSNN